MARPSNQQSLFDGLGQHKPSSAFTAYDVVFMSDGEEVARGALSEDGLDMLPLHPTVRVRLRLTGENVDAILPEGPLTYAECREWEEPCRLHSCRYRLEDAVEKRTRRVVETEDDYGRPVDTLQGPRLRNGAYYSGSTPTEPGDWCALRVAERATPETGLEEVANLYGVRPAVAEEMVQQAVDAVKDSVWSNRLKDFYGERGRMHGFKFVEDTAELTSREGRNAVVPGEVKQGRKALTVGGRRWKRDAWSGVKRRVPDVFEREDGTVVRTVPAEFLNPTRANDTIPVGCTDIGEMVKAREAAQRAKADRSEGREAA